MNADDFKTFAEGIQAVTFSAAAIVGGIWALYRFRYLLELPKARAENQKLRSENEKLLRDLEQRGTINISLTATPLTHPMNGTLWMSIRARLNNVGNRPEVLDWEKGMVRIAPVLGFQNEHPLLGEISTTRRTSVGEQTSVSAISPGHTRDVRFLIPVPSPGLYLVTLTVPGSREETQEALEERKRLARANDKNEKEELLARWKADAIVCARHLDDLRHRAGASEQAIGK